MKIRYSHKASPQQAYSQATPKQSKSLLPLSKTRQLLLYFNQSTRKPQRPHRNKNLKAKTASSNTNLFLSFFVILFTSYCTSAHSTELSVPAEFVMRLQPPGSNNDFLRPSDIFIDKSNGEVFIADPGKNRILIFDSLGTFLFEFAGAEHFSSPNSVIVDSDGYIYVLGSTREGRRIMKFDFDGLFLKEIPIQVPQDSLKTNYTCLTIDTNNTLYLLNQQKKIIYLLDTEGNLIDTIDLLVGIEELDRRDLIVSAITLYNDKIYVPLSSLGKVQIYDLQGEIIGSIGRKGNTVGKLNFPVKVAFASDDLMLVLDKHRINVVCFTLGGDFLGEFGGKGSSPGWFYHPTLLEVNKHNQVYVGQIFENKIQLCKIPLFITEKLTKSIIKASDSGGKNEVL